MSGPLLFNKRNLQTVHNRYQQVNRAIAETINKAVDKPINEAYEGAIQRSKAFVLATRGN